jgi:hypothetical protein
MNDWLLWAALLGVDALLWALIVVGVIYGVRG